MYKNNIKSKGLKYIYIYIYNSIIYDKQNNHIKTVMTLLRGDFNQASKLYGKSKSSDVISKAKGKESF